MRGCHPPLLTLHPRACIIQAPRVSLEWVGGVGGSRVIAPAKGKSSNLESKQPAAEPSVSCSRTEGPGYFPTLLCASVSLSENGCLKPSFKNCHKGRREHIKNKDHTTSHDHSIQRVKLLPASRPFLPAPPAPRCCRPGWTPPGCVLSLAWCPWHLKAAALLLGLLLGLIRSFSSRMVFIQRWYRLYFFRPSFLLCTIPLCLARVGSCTEKNPSESPPSHSDS